jgi:hypothetical protein
MNWRLAALLALIATLSACAEGGSRGSGIFTEVRGNVESVQTAAAPARLRASLHDGIEDVAPAATGIAGIRVAVEGTDSHGETDTNGNFSLRGNFDGIINLVFLLPDEGGQAQIGLNVPAGGQLTLNNVTVDAQQGAAVAETQAVDFDGIITGIDCQTLILTLVSTHQSPDDTDEYTLRLDTSSVRNAQGDPVACADIRTGEQASVQGYVNPDGTFGEATVVLD